jgi:hypothetical protein
MTKVKFCEAIRQLEEGENLQRRVASAVRQYNNVIGTDFPEPFGMVITHDYLVQDLLAEIMEDKFGDIEYFCETLEYGKCYYPGALTDNEGNPIELRTPENLYDHLVKLKENRSKN